jgi:nitroreductase
MSRSKFIPLPAHREYPEAEMVRRAAAFYEDLSRRRTVREFSSRPVPRRVIEDCIRAAGTAPNGANMQPWHFVAVSDPEIKRQIRVEAEVEEIEFYQHRAPKEWLDALAPLGTDEHKPFLEIAPALIVVFRHVYDLEEGRKVTNYYTQESVGIASGFLLCALHRAGLATLTHTPSPMNFLQEILERPLHERAYLLIPVGVPADDCLVPNLAKKPLDEIRVEYRATSA